METLKNFNEIWFSNEILSYGIGPGIAFNIGFWIPSLMLELIIYSSFFKKNFIKYSKNVDRESKLNSSRSIIPFKDQIKTCIKTTLGPTAIANCILSYYIFKYLVYNNSCNEKIQDIPNVKEVLINLLVLELIGDFFLYIGHRIQHEIPFLWKYHSFHHKIETPSPMSTLYISPIDETLQGALPLIITISIIKPHLLIVYIYIIIKIAENVLNHSGLDSLWIDILSLKILPFRAKISHHDRHHKYMGICGRTKNYGENFIIWDWMFGTL